MSMIIISYTQDRFEETGVVAEVYPFGYDKGWELVVYPGIVMIDGAASLSPELARDFAKAVQAAANMAEVNIGRKKAVENADQRDTAYQAL